VAIHKAVPVATAPTEPFRPDDVEDPAAVFPDLTFELVHGGFNFLEETAFQAARFPNIVINLENTSGLLVKQPGRFARIFGELLLWAGADKIVWGTGACAFHPRPLLEAFAQFDFAEEMKAEFGYPTMTPEIREAVLGVNAARIHGLEIGALKQQWHDDAVASWREEGTLEPWSVLRQTTGSVP
jgi:predicted TIM-barrel fold metal-dependent hydrolase